MTKTNNTPEDGARLNAVCRTGGDSVAKSIGLCIENGERERMRAGKGENGKKFISRRRKKMRTSF